MDSTDFSLIVDAGGFSKGYGTTAQLQTDYLLKGMSLLNYDCINLATKDFPEGGDFLKRMSKKHDIDFVSSNIIYAESGDYFTHPFVMKKISASNGRHLPFKKLTIALFGLCDQKERLLPNRFEETPLQSLEPIEAAKKILPQLKKADLVVLFYNGRFKTLEVLLDQVDGIDIVIMGGEYYRADHYSGKEVIIASTPSLGKYFGTLTVELDQNKNIVASQKRRIPMDEKIADDPKLAELVADFNIEHKKVMASRNQASR